MAVISWTKVAGDDRNFRVIKWSGLNANDVGQGYNIAEYPDATIQVEGDTLTSGITIEGSIDPSDSASYRTLSDPQGNALDTITTAKIESVLEHVYWIRPTAGASVVNATIYLMIGTVR